MQSATFEEFPQGNGTKLVIQYHTDNTGVVHTTQSFYPDGVNIADLLPAVAAQIEADLVAAEIQANLDEMVGG